VAHKSFIDRLQTEDVRPKDRLAFAGLCLVLAPITAVLMLVSMAGVSGWLVYLAVKQIITGKE